jgi:hypothetical protein
MDRGTTKEETPFLREIRKEKTDMTTKYGKTSELPKAFWEALRKHLAKEVSQLGTWAQLGEKLETSPDAYRKFIQGRAGALSEASLQILRDKGMIPEEIEALAQEATTKVEHPPLEGWQGEVKTLQEASQDKGYSCGSLRKFAKTGRLNYIRNGRKIMIAVDAPYESLPEKPIAVLRKEVANLRKENSRLRAQVESQQLQFAFETSAQNTSEIVQNTSEIVQNTSEIVQPTEPVTPGFYRVICQGQVIPGWKLASQAIGDYWPAKRINGVVKSAKVRIPSREIVIEVDHQAQTVVVPPEVGQKLLAS